MKRTLTWLFAVGVVASLFVLGLVPNKQAVIGIASTVQAGDGDLCGATITADVELDHDLACSADGITIGADGVKLALAGHTISGSGAGSTGVGIRVSGRSAVNIEGPGVVQGFLTGIQVTDSSDVKVARVTATQNGLPRVSPVDPRVGIRVIASTFVRLERNITSGNGDVGISLVSTTDSLAEENLVVNNGHDGIVLDVSDRNRLLKNALSGNGAIQGFGGCGIEAFGSKDNLLEENTVTQDHTGIRFLASSAGVASTGNTIRENVVSISYGADAGRRHAGINLMSGSTTGNLFEENQILGNMRGILLSAGPTGNTFVRNIIANNVCGVVGSTPGTFEENTLVNNITDFCP